jgi:hypothetical protein
LRNRNVSLFDSVVQRRAVQVVDASLVVATEIRCRQPPVVSFSRKSTSFCPRAMRVNVHILPAEKEARVQHHFDQEGSLPMRESEAYDALDALLVRHRNSSKMRGLGLRPDRPPRPPRPVLMRYELKPVRPFAAA